MPTPEEYHQYARESLEAAAKAKTEAERQAFRDMARTLDQAAMQMEGSTLPPLRNRAVAGDLNVRPALAS